MAQQAITLPRWCVPSVGSYSSPLFQASRWRSAADRYTDARAPAALQFQAPYLMRPANYARHQCTFAMGERSQRGSFVVATTSFGFVSLAKAPEDLRAS